MPKGRLPSNVLDFKQFLLRKQVLSFYREVLKVIREETSTENRKQLKDWARYEFESKKNLTDYVKALSVIIDSIKMQLSKGKLTLKELSSAIKMAK
eukprot:gene534-1188_t